MFAYAAVKISTNGLNEGLPLVKSGGERNEV